MLNDDGRTTSTREKILTITVKRGWKEGTQITFTKEGDQGPNKIPGGPGSITQVGKRVQWKHLWEKQISYVSLSLQCTVNGNNSSCILSVE